MYTSMRTTSTFALTIQVESLTAARSAAMNGNEPSDAVRVVNAVLTQIDSLKSKDNVLVLTTSNISKAIDLAFVDRYVLQHTYFYYRHLMCKKLVYTVDLLLNVCDVLVSLQLYIISIVYVTTVAEHMRVIISLHALCAYWRQCTIFICVT
jgi:ATPase family associated with various cellular activities (AAA)